MPSKRKRRPSAPAGPPLTLHPVETLHGAQVDEPRLGRAQYVHWLDVETLHGTPTDGPSVEEPDLEPPGIGSVLGKYELVAQLGRGTTSVVFEGRHRKLQIPVAVKLLHRDALANSPQF